MQGQSGIKVDSVKKNFIYQSLYQLVSLILPFITAPYIARVLGTEGTGIYSFANSVMYFFTMAANLGITNYGNREIASCIENKEKLSTKFWEIYYCHAFISGICILAYGIYVMFFSTSYKDVFLWQSFQLIATLFDITWFFAGIQKFKITVIRNFVIRIITVFAIFGFVKEPDDVWKYLFILSFGNFVGQVAVWSQLKQYISLIRVNIKNVLSHIKPLLVLFVPIIAMSIYRYMDKVMIPLLSDTSELGLYENSEKIVSLPLSLITTIGVVLLPKMSSIASTRDVKEANRYFSLSMKYSMILAFGLTCGLIGVSPVFAPIFFGEEFRRCSELIPLLSITVVFLTISNSIRSQYLIPNKQDSAYIVAAFSGAFVNLVINSMLIPLYGAKGAVVATIITELIVSVIHILYTFRCLHFEKIAINILPFILPALIMLLVIKMIGHVLGEKVITILLQVIVGTGVFCAFTFLILLIQKDGFCLSLVNELRQKIKKLEKE